MAYNTVEQEIKELEEKQARRNQSLIDSSKELEDDKMDLHHYIAQDKALREKKEEDQKKLETEKAQKDDRIKKLDQEISAVRSEIEKNKDALVSLTTNQQFLLDLAEPEYRERRDKRISDKYEALKKQWIADHMADPRLDYDIIFKTDDEIHDGEKMVFSFHGKDAVQGQENRSRKVSKDFSDHAQMTMADWELAFKKLLQLHLISVPSDFYEDELPFSDTNELTEKFQKQEEENLRKIHDQQTKEEMYEKTLIQEQQSKDRKERNYNEQNKTRLEL